MYYQWATRIPITVFQDSFNNYKKIAIKANSAEWIGMSDPVIVLFSVDSVFNEDEKGLLNVKALMSTIKQQIQGPITILLTEKAHLHALSLEYNKNIAHALEQAQTYAYSLADRFKEEFQGCKVTFWHDFINMDTAYQVSKDCIMQVFHTDTKFQQLLEQDAMRTYIPERAEKFDQDEYIQSTIQDLLEQCIHALVTAKKGYKFSFYPGRQNDSLLYVNEHMLPTEQRMTYVHMNIAFEKR